MMNRTSFEDLVRKQRQLEALDRQRDKEMEQRFLAEERRIQSLLEPKSYNLEAVVKFVEETKDDHDCEWQEWGSVDNLISIFTDEYESGYDGSDTEKKDAIELLSRAIESNGETLERDLETFNDRYDT